MNDDPGKRAAGYLAADLVESGMVLGLGTGSTVSWFLQRLSERRLDIAGVPTSRDTEMKCRSLGIRLLETSQVDHLDLCVDGADELDRTLHCTKGGGGALLREKVVARLSSRMVVIATEEKLVDRLGDTFPVPIEVVPFAVPPVLGNLRELGAEPVVRMGGDYLTDNGNCIIDARIPGGLEDPSLFEAQCLLLPGVAECGIFSELASLAFLGRVDGTVLELRPENQA